MPSYVKHHESPKAGVPEVVGAGEVPMTQDSIALGGTNIYEQYASLETASQSVAGGVLTWQIPSSTMMTDTAESYIVFQGSYALVGPNKAYTTIPNTTTDHTNSIYTPPFLAQCIMQDIAIEFNGTTVAPSQGITTPYCSVADTFKNESRGYRFNNDFTQGTLLDTWNQGDKFGTLGTADTNLNGKQRAKWYIEGSGDTTLPAALAISVTRQFTLTLRFQSMGFRTKSWLPPGVQIRIRGRRSNDAFLWCGVQQAAGDVTPTYVLSTATAFVSRKNLKEHAMRELQAGWVERPLKVPYEGVRSAVQFFPQATKSISVTGLLGGPIPKCVYVLPLRNNALQGTAYSGTQNDNSMVIRPPSGEQYWTNLSMSLGTSRIYPTLPLNTVPCIAAVSEQTLALSQLYQMYKDTVDGDTFLDSSSFTDLQPICFQITQPTDGWDETEEVQIQFQATLSGSASNRDYALVFIGFYDNLIEISHTGMVTVE